MSVPEGFTAHTRKSAVTDAWEPLYARRTDEALQLGLRVSDRHCNSRGFLHGGVVATLVDNAMGLTLGQATARRAVTVNLSVDYVGSAKPGQWLQIEPRLVRAGSTIGVVDALVTADGDTVARANATFRIVA